MLIDTFADDWLAQVDLWAGETEQAPDTAAAKSELFFLFFGAFVPGLHLSVADALGARKAPVLLFESLPGCNKSTRDVSPMLLPYRATNTPLRKALLRCNGWPMVHAITTPESQDILGQRLAAWCVLEADGQYFNFRFPDTRRLPGLLKALTAQQLAHFVGPASSWRSMGRNGQWQVSPALAQLPLPRATEPLDTRLTAAQFSAMLADGEADGILVALQDRGHTWSRPHSEVYADIAQALHIADAAGALALDDVTRIDWCEACMADPALLAQHPEAAPSQQKLHRWLEDNRA